MSLVVLSIQVTARGAIPKITTHAFRPTHSVENSFLISRERNRQNAAHDSVQSGDKVTIESCSVLLERAHCGAFFVS